MTITARNLAAALVYLGADVESALLELVAVAPSLDAKMRKALFAHNEPPQLRLVKDRNTQSLYFTDNIQSKYTCAMHAVDILGLAVDDASIIAYLQSKFPELDINTLVRT